MILLRWLAFSMLLVLGVGIVIRNGATPFRENGGTLIPGLGGAFAAVALVVVPADSLHWLWWAPLIVDLAGVNEGDSTAESILLPIGGDGLWMGGWVSRLLPAQ